MSIGDKVVWYDLTWISGQMGCQRFDGTVTGEARRTLIPCTPNGVGSAERCVPAELVCTNWGLASVAAAKSVRQEQASFNRMFAGIVKEILPNS